jgi:uncharacterized protein (TIGR04145 family)
MLKIVKKISVLMCCALMLFLSLNGKVAMADDVEATNTTGAVTIKIDGDFSDWSDLPKTVVSSWNPPESDENATRTAYKHESLVADANNIYLYVRMTEAGGNNTMVAASYLLTVGTNTYRFQLANLAGENVSFTKTSLAVGQTQEYKLRAQLASGTSSTLTSSDAVMQDSNVKAFVTRTANVASDNPDGYTDEMELCIPFSALGITGTNTGQVITERNDSIGNQTLSTSGGSTGPVVLAGIGFGVAILGVVGVKFTGKESFAKLFVGKK